MIVFDGWHVGGFHLETAVMTTLVGGTAAAAFGLVSIVLGGLFKNGGSARHESDRARNKERTNPSYSPCHDDGVTVWNSNTPATRSPLLV